jgi:hypothetical protein
MNIYETIATVTDQGEVRLSGVPFVPGAEVEVTIREKAVEVSGSPANLEEARLGLKELFARLRGRNTDPVGPLRREELYDRKVLR